MLKPTGAATLANAALISIKPGWRQPCHLFRMLTPTRALTSLIGSSLVLAACATASPGAPKYSRGAQEGRAIVRDLCSGCHAVGETDSSPRPDAPPLRGLLATYDPAKLDADLKSGAVMDHANLPKVTLSANGAQSVYAYLTELHTAAGDR
jgi:cytochrome c553